MTNVPVALLLLSAIACSPTSQETAGDPRCPDLKARENDAARTLALEPPVELVSIGCTGAMVGDPDLGLGTLCGIALRDASGNTSLFQMVMYSGTEQHPKRALRFGPMPDDAVPPIGDQRLERSVQVLLGIWLTRTFTLDEIAQLSLANVPCVRNNSPQSLAATILQSLSKETDLIIEIIVCGT